MPDELEVRHRPDALRADVSSGAPRLVGYAMFAERMRTLLAADKIFVGAMSNGTSGNINNVNFSVTDASRTPGAGAGIFQTDSAYRDLDNTYDPGGRLGQIALRFNW